MNNVIRGVWMRQQLINRYVVRCPYCRGHFAIEGTSPFQRSTGEMLGLVNAHAVRCPKTAVRLEVRRGDAYQLIACDWKVTQVWGTYKADVRCNGKCLHAKGGDCECSCGGKNHGSGLVETVQTIT